MNRKTATKIRPILPNKGSVTQTQNIDADFLP